MHDNGAMTPRNGEKRPGAPHDSNEGADSGRDDPAQAVALAIHSPLAALVANLALVAEALDGERSALVSRLDDTRVSLRDAREAAERIRSW